MSTILVLSGCADRPPVAPQVVYQQVPVLIAIPEKYLKDCEPDYTLDGDPKSILISDILRQSIIRSDRLKKCGKLHADLIAFYVEARNKFQINPTTTSPGIILSNIQ
ncbi:hypothetical protein KFS98_003611 [Salmonella enterica]|nr:hypothetical protein [Salmonella enterica]